MKNPYKIAKGILKFFTSRIVITILLVAAQMGFFTVELLYLQNYYVEIAVILRILSVFAVLYLICKPTNPSIKLAWIVPILIFPLLGGLMYLLFGHLILPKKLQKNYEAVDADRKRFWKEESIEIEGLSTFDRQTIKYVNRYGKTGLHEAEEVTYFPMGEQYYENLLEDLSKAEHYIFLEFFIIARGVMWNSILEILQQKIKQGVKVRLIYDDMGCIMTLPKHYAQQMKQLGIECIAYNRVFPFMAIILNNRDHRKIISIDGKVAYTGGINLADEYINAIQRFGTWKDSGVRFTGGAAWEMTIIFLDMWNSVHYTGENYEKFKPAAKLEKEAVQKQHRGYIQPYGTNPFTEEILGENIYLQIINEAKHYVYIYTPYLIVGDEMIKALQLAAKREVDVRIVTPGIPDKKLIYRLTQSYYKELIHAGVQILQYTPGFIHSKIFLSDDRIAVVGTVNMDYRSFYHHFECGAIFYQTDISEQIKKDMSKTFMLCENITEEWCVKKRARNYIIDPILKLLSPLF